MPTLSATGEFGTREGGAILIGMSFAALVARGGRNAIASASNRR
jgi:hypothetical protein